MRIKLALALMQLFFVLPAVAQKDGVNCVIFVNGKLPHGSDLTGNFSYPDSLNQKQIIPFDYTIGELNMQLNHAKQLCSLPFDHPVEVTLTHINYQVKRKVSFQGKRKLYVVTIMAGWLKDGYIIFRITTLKKDKYYFGISTSSLSSGFIKGEYDIFER